MTRTVKTHLTGDEELDLSQMSEISKAEFGRRLYTEILNRGWNQSELARRAGLPRDAISTYIRGKSQPTPLSLSKIAKALGKEPSEILPNQAIDAVKTDKSPSFEMRVSQTDPMMAYLKVDRLLPLSVAVQIAEIISKIPKDKEMAGAQADDAN